MRTVNLVLCITLAYAVTAYFGLQLAVPPGYATAVWAPSGLALGAVLVWGVRTLPGVFLGSFVVNFYISYVNSGSLVDPTAWMISCLIGIGALLQALFGWYLIKKSIGVNNTLGYPKDI